MKYSFTARVANNRNGYKGTQRRPRARFDATASPIRIRKRLILQLVRLVPVKLPAQRLYFQFSEISRPQKSAPWRGAFGN